MNHPQPLATPFRHALAARFYVCPGCSTAQSGPLRGLSLEARVTGATRTGTLINDVPQYHVTLEVAGPQGTFNATLTKLMYDVDAAQVIGHTLRVRANPNKLSDLIFEE
jgi:hypothetical protein